ncbi:ferritin-like domain-containing protein [Desulfococcus sp.]|uniref:ferritin-like domain-containing protein n=1 Tax=Desulfococcus sp. TaxID=2025834 RepID=UPI003D0F3704
MFLINEILDMAIQFEKNGEKIYREAADKVSDPMLSALLAWMADEESHHATYFSRLKQKHPDSGNHSFSRELSREMLDEILGDRGFSLEDVDFSNIADQNDMIRTFIEFEKDTILFYEMLTPFIEDPAAKRMLETIINEENRHVERLTVFLGSETAHPAFSDC